MKFRLALIPILLLLIGVQIVRAQNLETSQALDTLQQNVKEYQLSNGLKVVMYRRGTAPIFSGVVAVHVGGSDEEIGYTGISHMFEHMAFKGTETLGTKNYAAEKELLDELEVIAKRSVGATNMLPADQKRWAEIHRQLKKIWDEGAFWQAYESRGAVNLNATTDRDLTTYIVSMPKTALEFWAWMESERILHPVIRQYYQERDVVLEEKRMRYENAPEARLGELLFSQIYTLHPYRMPVIGYDFDIKHITASDVKAFRERYYVPGNIAVALVGDVDPDKDIAVIEKYFSRIPVGPMPPRPPYVEPPQEGERRVILEEFASPSVLIAYRKPNYPDPDDPPLSVMYDMLAGSRTSYLYEELVKKQQIATGVAVSDEPGFQYPNTFVFQGAVRAPHTTEDFLVSFDKAVADFKAKPIDEAAVQLSKTRLAIGYLQGLRSNLGLAKDLASSQLLQADGWKSIINWYKDAMAVDAKAVRRVADQYLVNRSRTIGYLHKVSKK